MYIRAIAFFSSLLLPFTGIADERGWAHYGASLAGDRYVAHSFVNPGNVDELVPAWQFRTGDMADGSHHRGRRSTFKATPILVGDSLVFQSGFNRVYSIDAATGTKRWMFDPEVDFSVDYAEMFTSRGVSAWYGEGDGHCSVRIVAGTLDARLIAIDATDGRRCKDFGDDGEIDLSQGIDNFRRGEYSLTSPVTVVNDVLVVGSSIGDNGAADLESGQVRGYDAATGALLWRWDPVSAGKDAPGGHSWGDSGGHATGAANVWSAMAADASRNLVFLPTTSPSPDFFGGQRAGRNRFSNSIVALNVTRGEPAWDFQVVHHDLWDYDNAAQSLLMTLARDGKTVPVVIQATKMGHVFVLHRDTGRPVFPVEERPVPQTDVPGEKTAATQPFPVRPPPLHDGTVRLWEYSESQAAACRKRLAGVRYKGIFTPPSLRGTLLFPGNGGGTNWGSMAAHPERGIAVLAINRIPTVVALIPREQFDERRQSGDSDGIERQYTAQRGTPYGMSRYTVYDPASGLPCTAGPWGELVALDISEGSVRWRRPLGVVPGLEAHAEAADWGAPSAGGPLITSSGVVFIAPRLKPRLLAYDLDNGSVIWEGQLPATATATPMSYHINDEQYVVIAAGGDSLTGEPPGDYVVAFRTSSAR